MRVGVFRLAYKTMKEEDDPDRVIRTFKLVFKDDLGNSVKINASLSDYEGTEPGDILELEHLFRQTTLPEG